MTTLRPVYYACVDPNASLQVVRFVEWLTPMLPDKYPARRKCSTPSELFREFSFNYEGVRYYDMARKSTKPTENKPNKQYRPAKWANIRLSDDDTPIITERCNNPQELVGELFVLFDNGFDVFIKRRDDNQTVQVSITGPNARNTDENVGLSAFAPDVITAISALLFKYHDIAGGVLEDYLTSSSGGIG